MDSCLGSRDGNTSNHKDADGLHSYGEPCVWCGGAACRTGSPNVCEPYDFLVHGKGVAFDDSVALSSVKVACCKKQLPEPKLDVECLVWNRLGCGRIEDKKTCLTSRDGRDLSTINGFKIGGQPCVWCGAACTDSGPEMCQPFDWVVHGQGVAFKTFIAADHYRVAGCNNGEVQNIRPWWAPKPPKPIELPPPEKIKAWWQPPAPTKEETSCLTYLKHGCNVIRDKDVCLSSRDGRQVVTHNMGLDLYGQAC